MGPKKDAFTDVVNQIENVHPMAENVNIDVQLGPIQMPNENGEIITLGVKGE